MRLLQRYVLFDVIRAFLLTLAGVTVLFLGAGLAAEAVRRGLTPGQIVRIVPYVLPSTLPYTIPATLLFGVVLVFGRMAADSEITACKAAGIHVLRLVAPVVALALLCSGLTWWALNDVIPPAVARITQVVAEHLEETVYNILRRERAITSNRLPCSIYVRDVQGRTLIGATFQRIDQQSGELITAYAERATLEFDLANRRIIVRMFDADVQVGSSIVKVGDEHVFPIPLPDMALTASDSPRQMTLRELRDAIRKLRERLSAQAQQQKEPDPYTLRRYRRLRSELHMRAALAFGSVLFVLIGCPVAIIQQRGEFLGAFVSCFLPIVVTYYPLLLLGMNMSKEGITHPGIALWTANAVLGVAAVPLLRRVIRY